MSSFLSSLQIFFQSAILILYTLSEFYSLMEHNSFYISLDIIYSIFVCDFLRECVLRNASLGNFAIGEHRVYIAMMETDGT
jgi:hypothetical protein